MNPDKFPTDKGTFLKRSPEWKNLKRRLAVLLWTENILKTEHFEAADVTIILYDFSGSFAFSNFFRISVDRKLLYVFAQNR